MSALGKIISTDQNCEEGPMKIAIYGKGGIGKSTMSANLTAALTDLGKRVMQIGCDPKHDSTRLLLEGEVRDTILDYLRDTPRTEMRLEDVISVGYKGCLCAEAGGPEPGVGCAGRGIISSFNLLNELGIESVEKDIVLFDVLGDVVCGGFAIPLRDRYSDIVFIVSSGEFMSIYAANNILRGISNYGPNRVGGIIFNSRGDPEERDRIERFSEAVGVPIIASFERSELFMRSERRGKTVVELFPDSEIARSFIELAKIVLRGERHASSFLSEQDLESKILGRSIVRRDAQPAKLRTAVADRMRIHKFLSRNVSNNEEYIGCAFSGAQTVCLSVDGLTTILHSPLSCAHNSFNSISDSFCRGAASNRGYVRGYCNPSVDCTAMHESAMIFGGSETLYMKLNDAVKNGAENIAVITACHSGIIGDDVEGVVSRIETEHPSVNIALIDEEGILNGDFVQGIIDTGIALAEKFVTTSPKSDTVNLIGPKLLSSECAESVEVYTELLKSIGVEVNCVFPGFSDIESLKRLSSAKMNIMMNCDTMTVQMCTYLNERFGIAVCPVPIRPGISGTCEWLRYVAESIGHLERYELPVSHIVEDFVYDVNSVSRILTGKRYCILSATKEIDWIIEAADEAEMIMERAVIIDKTDCTNDMGLVNTYPNVMIREAVDLETEKEEISRISPDVLITTAHVDVDVLQIAIPIVPIAHPLVGAEFMRTIAMTMISPEEEGWRKDVV